MFGKLLRQSTFYTKCVQIPRNIFISSSDYSPRNFDKTTKTENLDNDIKTVAEIESNLFGNAEKLQKPVNSSELLKKYKIESQRRDMKMFPKKDKTIPTKSKNAPTKSELPPIIKDTDLGLEYLRLGMNDPYLSKLLQSAKSRKYRDKNNQIIVEGRRLILEAIEGNCTMRTLLFSQKEQLNLIKDTIKQLKNVQIIRVPQHNLKVWSTLATCPGLLAICDRPDDSIELTSNRSEPLPITVVCDNIRESNNLGSVIRSCAAIPCAQILVLKGCCDPWETKALRGGCGGQFRIKIKDDVVWEDLETILPDDYSVFIAENNLKKFDNQSECPVLPYYDVNISSNHNVLVIGGETYGVSESAYNFLLSHKQGSCLHIPLAKGVDSLNTAAALTLILFEMKKLFIEKQLTEKLHEQSAN